MTPTGVGAGRFARFRLRLLTVLYSAALASGALALYLLMPAAGAQDSVSIIAALTLGFLLAESLIVHIPAKRDSHSISLVEIPLVVGLAFVTPAALVMARLAGSGVSLIAVRKQRNPLKLGFNLATFALETMAACMVFRSVAAGAGSTDLITWVAIACALLAFQTIGALAVAGVISINDERPSLANFVGTYQIGLAGSVASGAWGVVTVAVIESAPLAAVPLGGLAAGLYWLLGVFGRLRRRHEDLKLVHSFTTALDRVDASAELPGFFLEVVNDHFMTATSVLFAETEGRLEILSLDDAHGLRAIATPRDLHFRDVASTLGSESNPIGSTSAETISRWCGVVIERGAVIPIPATHAVLVLGNPRPGHSIGPAEIDLLATLGAHAGSVFERHRLFGALEEEVQLRQYQALHDELTGLPNRSAFLEDLARLMRVPRTDFEIAVLLLDLDDFKAINDTLSHKAGDQVLIDLARRLQEVIRSADIIARVGGDEFAAAIRVGTAADAIAVAHRIKEGLHHPFISGGLRVEVGASIGVAVGAATPITMLRRADIAMYAAKDSESGVEVYRDEINDYDASILELAGELRPAIASGQVQVYYQPKVRTSDESIAGFEALARWIHPTRGFVSPADFIPTAERTGLMLPLTEHVLITALMDAAGWRDRGWKVSVNFSPKTIAGSSMERLVADALHSTGATPDSLVVEVTESGILPSRHASSEVLDRIHDLGVMISIDDFGTGFSSMSRLRSLPVNELKIDRSFISTFETDPGNRAIVETTIDLAKRLDLTTVAEGAEEASTVAELRRLGVDEIQGYYYSPALPIDRLWDWIAEHESRTGLRAAG